jgi:GNAT superfamily N-acetyltransferase
MKYAAKALEAIEDWEKSTGAFYIGGPFFARDFGEGQGIVVFEIKNWSEGIALSLIKTPPEYRGKGLASRALKELLAFADKHGVPVTGSVAPQEDEGQTLSKAQLKAWYGRHGFKNKRVDQIYRPPVASRIVDCLLEADEVDPKTVALRTEDPYDAAAIFALRLWTHNLPNIDKAIRDATHDRPNVLATATSQVLDHYITAFARQAALSYYLDVDDEAELRRFLMRAWQHERTGAKSSEVAKFKQRLGEADEIDPKGFVTRVSNIDLNELRELIRAKVPGLGVIRFHLLPIWRNPPFFRYDLNLLLAKEPVSADGFDPANDVAGEAQRDILKIVQDWIKDRGLTLRENRFVASLARYKSVCPVHRIVFTIDCDLGFQIVNHDNDLDA